MEDNMQFYEFERLLDKGNLSVYHEESDYISGLGVGLILLTIGVMIIVILGFISGIIQNIGLLLILVGFVLSFRGLILNRTEKRKYEFKGLSRTTISEAVMYLDSIIAHTEELESPVPYHGKTALSSYEQSKKLNAFIKFVKRTADVFSWSSDFIIKLEKDTLRQKRRMILLPILAVILSLIIAYGTYAAMTSGLPILAISMAYSIPSLLSFSLFCIAESVYAYARIPVIHQSAQINTSDLQKNEDTLKAIFALLRLEYHYPLRFYLVREYPTLKYTGRTKTSFTIIRLKEALLYPTL